MGTGLVIDHSKHLRKVLDVNVAERTVKVEPGIVLDHLNAQLKPHGLWYPVDVSTSAQATLGGMAGNNSCGSRSIAYGNMVHNVLGADVLLSSRRKICLSSYQNSSGFERELGDYVKSLAYDLQPEMAANWPKVMRRVGGYNLDIFQQPKRKALHHRWLGEPGASDDRQRRHTGHHAVADFETVRAANDQSAGRRQLSTAFTKRWIARSTSSSLAAMGC